MTWAARGAWALAGLLWFLWVGYEDQGLVAVTIVGASLSLAIGLTAAGRRLSGRVMTEKRWILSSAGLGLACGMLATFIAALLILVKTSLHTHPYLDFSAADIGLLLTNTGVWAAGGLLVGIAAGLATAGLSRR